MVDNDVKTIQEEYIDSKCPNCASQLRFFPGSNKLKCDSCSSEFEIESLGSGRLDDEEVNYADTLSKLAGQVIETKKQRVIHCEDCGGLINLNDRSISTICPFCGSNKVIEEDKEDEIIKINGVVPFILNEKDVKYNFKRWIKKKLLAPRKFRNGTIEPSFAAFYIPYYTFDSDTQSNYSGYRGDYYYVTKTVKTNNGTKIVRERRTRWTYRTGRINLKFDDLLINGTNNHLKNYVDKISNYDFLKMQKYQEEYLLGYYSEKPSVSLQDGFSFAKERMINVIRTRCIQEIGGDTYRDLKFQTNYSDVTFKQIMAPIYNGHYKYNNKKYLFVCNGQTGQFTGKYPISPLKITLIVLVSIALLVGVIIGLYFLFI